MQCYYCCETDCENASCLDTERMSDVERVDHTLVRAAPSLLGVYEWTPVPAGLSTQPVTTKHDAHSVNTPRAGNATAYTFSSTNRRDAGV